MDFWRLLGVALVAAVLVLVALWLVGVFHADAAMVLAR